MTGNTGWTFPDVWEQVAAAFPDAPAAIHGDRCISWAEFDRRAAALAATLLAHSLGVGAKVASGPSPTRMPSSARTTSRRAGPVPTMT